MLGSLNLGRKEISMRIAMSSQIPRIVKGNLAGNGYDVFYGSPVDFSGCRLGLVCWEDLHLIPPFLAEKDRYLIFPPPDKGQLEVRGLNSRFNPGPYLYESSDLWKSVGLTCIWEAIRIVTPNVFVFPGQQPWIAENVVSHKFNILPDYEEADVLVVPEYEWDSVPEDLRSKSVVVLSAVPPSVDETFVYNVTDLSVSAKFHDAGLILHPPPEAMYHNTWFRKELMPFINLS